MRKRKRQSSKERKRERERHRLLPQLTGFRDRLRVDRERVVGVWAVEHLWKDHDLRTQLRSATDIFRSVLQVLCLVLTDLGGSDEGGRETGELSPKEEMPMIPGTNLNLAESHRHEAVRALFMVCRSHPTSGEATECKLGCIEESSFDPKGHSCRSWTRRSCL